MTFQERLEAQMKSEGVKGIDIVNKLKISKGTVSQWRNGVSKPRGENAVRLAKFLRCNLTWLIEGKGLPNKNLELELGPDLRGKAPLIS